MTTTASVFYYMHIDYVANVNGNGAWDPRVSLFALLFLSWFVNVVVHIKESLTHTVLKGGGGGVNGGRLTERDQRKMKMLDFQ